MYETVIFSVSAFERPRNPVGSRINIFSAKNVAYFDEAILFSFWHTSKHIKLLCHAAIVGFETATMPCLTVLLLAWWVLRSSIGLLPYDSVLHACPLILASKKASFRELMYIWAE